MLILDNEPIVMVCAADDDYAMPLTVTICSVLANLSTNCTVAIFIIDGGMRKYNKRKIIDSVKSDKVSLKWLKIDDKLLSNMLISRHITLASYYRILIPNLLSNQYKKAIYLDSDLIVKGNLELLWNIDIEENYLLAVPDIDVPHVSSPKGLRNYQQLGIPSDAKYFNAGVLVINLDKWRSNSTSVKVIQYIEQNKEHVRWHDQDGLNAVLPGKWGELDLKWNQSPKIYEYSSWKDSPFSESLYNDILHNPYIVHFSSSGKPWKLGCRHPAKSLFFEYIDMTAWSGWRLSLWRRLWLKFRDEMKTKLKVIRKS